MEQLFKQKLLSLRNPKTSSNFEEAVYGDLEILFESDPIKKDELNISTEHFSEKRQVLESLDRFAHEQFASLPDSDDKLIHLDGGLLAQKPELGWTNLMPIQNLDALITQLSLSQSMLELSLNKKVKGSLKIVFVTEQFRSWEEISSELTASFLDEIVPAFPLKVAEYFGRMLKAMQLEMPEIILYPCEIGDRDLSDEIALIASFFRPEIIVTLGAKATHRMLKSQERLAIVHGQFFQRKLGEFKLSIVPLFHPTIIENNVNMKKTAWSDMQKIMKHLKKLP